MEKICRRITQDGQENDLTHVKKKLADTQVTN